MEFAERDEQPDPPRNDPSGLPRILAVGVGGGGCNAVNRMIEANVRGVEFIAMNTDAQALGMSHAPTRLRLGETLTRGRGAGGDPEIGHAAAEESYDAIQEILRGADMVFITAGMGGGTGTGAAPLIAHAARECGALAVAVVTTPFAFERKRKSIAQQGVRTMRDVVDALIVVPNERLEQFAGHDISMEDAFRLADDVLRQSVQGISDLMTIPGLINLDFADVHAIMAGAGSALMGIGQASGEHRAETAARAAISNPLLEVDIRGARGVLFNITGGDDLLMREIDTIASIISGAAHPDANIIFGAVHDPANEGTLKVTVVATGFEPRISHERERPTWSGTRTGIPQSPPQSSRAPAPAAYPSRTAAPAPNRPTTSVPPPAAQAPRPSQFRQPQPSAQPPSRMPTDTAVSPPQPPRTAPPADFTVTAMNRRSAWPDAEAPASRAATPPPTPASAARPPSDRTAPDQPWDDEPDDPYRGPPNSVRRLNSNGVPPSSAVPPLSSAQSRPNSPNSPSSPGYHGDEYVENDPDDDSAPPPRHLWDFLTRR
ncbi:MAG: Cell division protein FtsZ [Ktedonobacterales bacterium]|jgi:cell division protein FtsZ|nr:MAG: Cell division protein FtsZ [Ktedonobacterales bacterium]